MRVREMCSRLPLTHPAPPGLWLTHSCSDHSRLGLSQGRVGEGQHVVAECGGLRLLEIGLVRHEGLRLCVGDVRDLIDETGHLRHQAQDLAPQFDPQCQPPGLASWPARVQPSGVQPEPAGEEPLPAVIGIPVHRVVGEIGGGHGVDFQQQPEQALR